MLGMMNTAKEARRLYKEIGVTLILFLILFGLARDYLFIPLLGKIWGLALITTPEGFICNANLVDTLLKSPWIVLIGFILVIIYAMISMWQVSAIILGISYAYRGKSIKLLDLFKISFMQIDNRVNKDNWMLLVYSLIIVPFANVYQTNDVISSFILPEYIQDFINEKTVLFILFIVGMALIVYLALRWFYLLPAFILKKKDFKEAKEESDTLTKDCWFKTGVNVSLYSVIEFIRLSILPMVLILLPIYICYSATRELKFATHLNNIIGIDLGLEVVKCFTGTLVQISSICFMVKLYFTRLREEGISTEIELPELESENKRKVPLIRFLVICSIAYSLVIAGTYLATVNIAQTDSNVILELFGRTEIIAHKGYSSKAPENTMPAFELADKCEAVTYIELDVWTSKDGVPVVIHNSNIKDATGIDKEIYECTVEELRNTPAPYSMDKEKFPNAYIPTLEEVIEKYADSTPLLIEIKGFKQDPKLPEKIVELMKKYDCEYTSLIQSGDYGALEEVKHIDPRIQCGLILAMVTGNYYDIPYADFFSIEHTFVNQNTNALLHRRGKEVYAWTVNYSESADELRFSGVDGIITDVPEEISEYVSDSNNMITEVISKKISNIFDGSAIDEALTNFVEGTY